MYITMFDSLMVLIIGNSTTLAWSTYAVISRVDD